MAPLAGGPVVVVGAGQAGLQIAESLRGEGHDGPIALIGAEPGLPYHRPPLSKDVLLGEATADQIVMRAADALARKGIDLIAGTAVEAIDRAARTVRLADGRTLPYAGLALATGARVRPLAVPGADLAGVLPLRTLADSLAILDALPAARRVVVIGGGFIGLEVAAAARTRGAEVTVLEAADRLMGRAVSPPISEHFLALHRSRGVEVRLGARVTELRGADGRVGSVLLADGGVLPADLVVYGIGVIADDRLARAAGLACDGGIRVDDCGRTDDPAIVAAGDCTVSRDPLDGGWRRLESVQNAVEQGKAAAAALMGRDKPFHRAPWFWSTQFGVKLQMVGSSAGHDAVTRQADTADEGRFSFYYHRGGVLIGVDSVGRPQDHMAARKRLDPLYAGIAQTE